MHSDPHAMLQFADFQFDAEEGRLRCQGQDVPLQPRQIDALRILLEARGRLVSRDAFFATLWPGGEANDEALSQVIRRLRVALGDDPRAPRFIQTVPKRGYRWLLAAESAARSIAVAEAVRTNVSAASVVLVAPTAAATPPTSVDDADVASDRPAEPTRSSELLTKWPASRPWVWQIAAALLAALTMGGFWLYSYAPPPTAAAQTYSVRRLSFSPERETTPHLARDGSRIVFARNVLGQHDLFLMDLASEQLTELTRSAAEETEPRFAPGGERVAFVRAAQPGATSEIVELDLTAGTERQLIASGRDPAWSADGQRMAFVRDAAGGSELWLRDLGGAVERRLLNAAALASPSFSPDGQTLACVADGQILAIDLASGVSRPLGVRADNVRSVSFEISGASLLTDANWGGRANLWRFLLDDPEHPEALTAGTGSVYYPSSALSGAIAFAQEIQTRELARLRPGASAPEVIPVKASVVQIAQAQNGAELLLSDVDAGQHKAGLLRLDLGDGAARSLYRGEECGFAAAYAPDGQSVAFLCGAGREQGLWLLQLASGAARRLGPGYAPSSYSALSFRADGRAIITVSAAFEGKAGLWQFFLDGRPPELLLAGDFRAASYAPDGARLALCRHSEAGAELLVRDLGDGAERVLYPGCSYALAPVWRADGRAVYLLRDERSAPRLLALGLDGAQLASTLLPPVSGPGFWGVFAAQPLPDGSIVYLSTRYESDLYLLEPTIRADAAP